MWGLCKQVSFYNSEGFCVRPGVRITLNAYETDTPSSRPSKFQHFRQLALRLQPRLRIPPNNNSFACGSSSLQEQKRKRGNAFLEHILVAWGGVFRPDLTCARRHGRAFNWTSADVPCADQKPSKTNPTHTSNGASKARNRHVCNATIVTALKQTIL